MVLTFIAVSSCWVVFPILSSLSGWGVGPVWALPLVGLLGVEESLPLRRLLECSCRWCPGTGAALGLAGRWPGGEDSFITLRTVR